MKTLPHQEKPPVLQTAHQPLLALPSAVPIPEATRRQALALLVEMLKLIVVSERKEQNHE